MRLVLGTSDQSLAESLRVALEVEEIPAVTSNEGATGLPFIPITVMVDDADYDRARNILQSLQQTSRAPTPFRYGRIAIWVAVALASILCLEIFIL